MGNLFVSRFAQKIATKENGASFTSFEPRSFIVESSNVTMSLSPMYWHNGISGGSLTNSVGNTDANGFLTPEGARRKRVTDTAQAQFVEIARYENFEYGYTPPSERFINDFAIENPTLLGDLLQGIALDFAKDSQVMVAMLNALGALSYEAVRPFGQILALSSLLNLSIEVKEAAIRVYETWGHKEGAKVLAEVDCPWGWLDEYRLQVIAELNG